MAALAAANGVVSAQLGFLAIFNPSLGNTDETIDDQIVYYASVTTQSATHRRRRARGRPTDDISQDERHERLRQIGLAQGMASFGRGFADGATVDSIDTEKSKVVLHELEPGWWILASVDLTKIPVPPRLPTKGGERQENRHEYSTKEMKPGNLLLRDLLRAHSIFLLHHSTSLSAFFVRTKRNKFVTTLTRYWDLFLSTWSVMLHGNPIRGVFGGINLAASGELGVGVGEEDRGSGEREVLEGLVGRIEGLVDLVVSRFGEYDPEADSQGKDAELWLGTGQEPGPEDGAIFLGTGALSRKSLRDVTHWMEDLYTWGEHAYGVIESPTSTRRAKMRHASKNAEQQRKDDHQQVVETASDLKSSKIPTSQDNNASPQVAASTEEQEKASQEGGIEKMVSYLKMGYGTYWSLPGSSDSSTPNPTNQAAPGDATPEGATQSRPGIKRSNSSYEDSGHYLIGLKGEIEENQSDASLSHDSDDTNADHNSRTVLRTLNVELESEAQDRPEATIVRDFEHPGSMMTQSQVVGNMLPGYDSHDLNKASKLRVVVYVNRPFIFTFVFGLRTDSLAWDALYRSLHHQLAPLRKPLLASTKYRAERPNIGPAASSIHDLVWDPNALTVQSTIPNIPEQYTPDGTWSRADALSTHLQLLNIHTTSRSPKLTDLERTQKTNRGWWIVWTRLLEQRNSDESAGNLETIHESSGTNSPSNSATNDDDHSQDVSKEIFLVRCASDHARFRGMSGSYVDSSAAEGGRLAQGIGVDTRRYVEELLSLL